MMLPSGDLLSPEDFYDHLIPIFDHPGIPIPGCKFAVVSKIL